MSPAGDELAKMNRPRHTVLLWGLVAVGTVLRLRQYLSGRSLWLDESALAASFVQQTDIIDLLLHPLLYFQSAPPGFILAAWSTATAFGHEDWALRLAPLMAAVAALALAVPLARRALGSPVAQVAFVAMLALSPTLIYYASEFKPYSSDAFVSLSAMTAAACRAKPRGLLLLAVVGLIGIVLSLPAVLVLAPIALLLAYEAWIAKRLWPLALVAASWLAGAALHGLYLLSASADLARLTEYWRPAFAPSPAADPLWYAGAALELVHLAFFQRGPALPTYVQVPEFDTVEPTALAIVLAAALVVAAGAALRSKQPLALIAVGSIASTVLASAVHAYPFSSRLLIFLVPQVLLLLAFGLDRLIATRLRPLALAAGAGLVAVMVPGAAKNALHPVSISDMKGALSRVRSLYRDGDVVAVARFGRLIFERYQDQYLTRRVPVILFARAGENPRDILARARGEGARRVWFVIAHRAVEAEPLFREIGALAPKVYEWHGPGTRVVLFELAPDNDP